MFNRKFIPWKVLISGYFACGSLFATSAFLINMQMLVMYRDYYYRCYNKIELNIMGILFCTIPMIPKSLCIGLFWPFFLSDFILYSDAEHDYTAFRHIIPWLSIYFNGLHGNKILNENDNKKYIDINESLNKYGVRGFFLEGKCVKCVTK
jgi:hypothetical protein